MQEDERLLELTAGDLEQGGVNEPGSQPLIHEAQFASLGDDIEWGGFGGLWNGRACVSFRTRRGC